jgi:hypothetical protein
MLLLVLGACRSGPTRLHSLLILPPPDGSVPYSGPPVRVDAVHVPAELDRAEIITPMAGGGFKIHELDHWAAPLSTLARQTLTADLITRLPPGRVIVAPLDKPDGTLGLSVAILQFTRDSGGPQFVAGWQAGTSPAGESHLITLRSDAADTPSEVADRFSDMLAQIAERIATQLASLPNKPPP